MEIAHKWFRNQINVIKYLSWRGETLSCAWFCSCAGYVSAVGVVNCVELIKAIVKGIPCGVFDI